MATLRYTCGIVLLFLWTLQAFSQKGSIGLGITLGNPTGITAQYWTGEITAVKVNFGRQISGINHLLLAADFLVHPWSFDSEGDLIRLYLGAGAGLGFISDLSLSLRTTQGAAYFFEGLPLEVHADLNPSLQLVGPGDVKVFLGGFLGLRWYFRNI